MMEKYYLSLLVTIESMNIIKMSLLLKYFPLVKDIWHGSDEDFIEAGLDKNTIYHINERRIKYNVYDFAELCQNSNIDIITYYDDAYPKELLNITNAPLVLFVKGTIDNNDKIAVVGSRKATTYGISVATDFAADLSRAGVTVVSGGAKGIDTAAHIGAIKEKKPTIAVFGCGLNVIYPKENKKLFEQILDLNGALISEYLPDSAPIAWHFPMRNRIINGLAKGVLVVEANKKSGALITSNYAIEENREVYCVPGSIYSTSSIGAHNLIKQGAKLVDSPEDILKDLNNLFFAVNLKKDKNEKDVNLTGDNETIYNAMISGKKYNVDELSSLVAINLSDLLLCLLDLEMKGFIENQMGIYQKIERRTK